MRQLKAPRGWIIYDWLKLAVVIGLLLLLLRPLLPQRVAPAAPTAAPAASATSAEAALGTMGEAGSAPTPSDAEPTEAPPPQAAPEPQPPQAFATPLPACPALDVGCGAFAVAQGLPAIEVRGEPARAAAVIATLAPGTELYLLEVLRGGPEGTWWRLRTADGLEGWVGGDESLSASRT